MFKRGKAPKSELDVALESNGVLEFLLKMANEEEPPLFLQRGSDWKINLEAFDLKKDQALDALKEILTAASNLDRTKKNRKKKEEGRARLADAIEKAINTYKKSREIVPINAKRTRDQEAFLARLERMHDVFSRKMISEIQSGIQRGPSFAATTVAREDSNGPTYEEVSPSFFGERNDSVSTSATDEISEQYSTPNKASSQGEYGVAIPFRRGGTSGESLEGEEVRKKWDERLERLEKIKTKDELEAFLRQTKDDYVRLHLESFAGKKTEEGKSELELEFEEEIKRIVGKKLLDQAKGYIEKLYEMDLMMLIKAKSTSPANRQKPVVGGTTPSAPPLMPKSKSIEKPVLSHLSADIKVLVMNAELCFQTGLKPEARAALEAKMQQMINAGQQADNPDLKALIYWSGKFLEKDKPADKAAPTAPESKQAPLPKEEVKNALRQILSLATGKGILSNLPAKLKEAIERIESGKTVAGMQPEVKAADTLNKMKPSLEQLIAKLSVIEKGLLLTALKSIIKHKKNIRTDVLAQIVEKLKQSQPGPTQRQAGRFRKAAARTVPPKQAPPKMQQIAQLKMVEKQILDEIGGMKEARKNDPVTRNALDEVSAALISDLHGEQKQWKSFSDGAYLKKEAMEGVSFARSKIARQFPTLDKTEKTRLEQLCVLVEENRHLAAVLEHKERSGRNVQFEDSPGFLVSGTQPRGSEDATGSDQQDKQLHKSHRRPRDPNVGR